MVNIPAELRKLWHHHTTEDATLAQIGVDEVNRFRQDSMNSSDIAKVCTIGFTLLRVIQQNVDGALPDEVIDAVGRCLAGTHEIGRRRGKGEAYRRVGKKKRAARFIDPVTNVTLPNPTILADAMQRAEEVKKGKVDDYHA